MEFREQYKHRVAVEEFPVWLWLEMILKNWHSRRDEPLQMFCVARDVSMFFFFEFGVCGFNPHCIMHNKVNCGSILCVLAAKLQLISFKLYTSLHSLI